MKSCIYIALLFLPCKLIGALQIDLNSYYFFSEKPYAEIQVRAFGNSLAWQESNDISTSDVEIVLSIFNAKDSLINIEKLIMHGETTTIKKDLLLVRRYLLLPNKYKIEVEAKDIYSETGKIMIQQYFEIPTRDARVNLSDIQLLSICEKSSGTSDLMRGDWYMEPLPYGILTPTDTLLKAYFETYHDVMLQGDYFLQYKILHDDIDKINNDKPLITKYEKLQNNSTNAHLYTQPVQSLTSGKYLLIATVLDKQKNVISSQQVRFYKENPIADMAWLEVMGQSQYSYLQNSTEDQLDFDLKSLVPIISTDKINTLHEVVKSNGLNAKRNFIYTFWKDRENPKLAYESYRNVAEAVNTKFQTNAGLGIQSDRGYIFLKHGKPTNVITVDTEVDAPPYEIWYYYSLPTTKQTNVRFLFYNPSLVHNDFHLLHSTCLGERKNENWEKILYKNAPIDVTSRTQGEGNSVIPFNRNAAKFFNEY
ncbi:MAG: GWxTD domain-containing protein [Saprospiraceae bacterium]